jgi:hypothetical protein
MVNYYILTGTTLIMFLITYLLSTAVARIREKEETAAALDGLKKYKEFTRK